ncbi:MAG: hypothetical protein ACR2OB_11960 [Solirubrobacteraceae bacterium]
MIVTASGGLVTLILVLGGAARSTSMCRRPLTGTLFVVSLAFFGVAALLGLGVNVPWNGRVYLPFRSKKALNYSQWVATLTQPEVWGDVDVAEFALKIVAEKLKVVRGLRFKNRVLGAALVLSILAVVVATTCFAIATYSARVLPVTGQPGAAAVAAPTGGLIPR